MGFWVSKTPPTQSMRAWELLREPLRNALRSSSSAVWATDTHLSTRPPSLNGGNIPVLDSAYLDPQTILKTGLLRPNYGVLMPFYAYRFRVRWTGSWWRPQEPFPWSKSLKGPRPSLETSSKRVFPWHICGHRPATCCIMKGLRQN